MNFTSSVSLRLTPSPQWEGKGAGKGFALNKHNFTLHETLRFPAMFRHRDTAITVSVQPKCACGKSDPSVSFAASSPYAGEPMEVRSKICTALSGSGSFPVLSAASIPGKRNKCIRSCVKAPLKKRHTELLRAGRSLRRLFCRRLCATGPLRDSALRGRERRRA